MMLVNNTGADIRMFDSAIWAAIKSNGILPDEIADVFLLTSRTVGNEVRWFLNWA